MAMIFLLSSAWSVFALDLSAKNLGAKYGVKAERWVLESNCVQKKEEPPRGDLTIMSWNAHNLFDGLHDQGKDDWENMPSVEKLSASGQKKLANEKRAFCESQASNYRESCLKSDYSEKAMEHRIEQIIPKSLPRAQILALQEVENVRVVSRLARALGYGAKALDVAQEPYSLVEFKKSGMKPCFHAPGFAMTNSPDQRGIDVALTYDTKLKDLVFHSCTEYYVPTGRATRNLLEVGFDYRGDRVYFYVVHWPSQGGPTKEREIAADRLTKLMTTRTEEGAYVIALGDFNVLDRETSADGQEQRSPVEDRVLAPMKGEVLDLAADQGKTLPTFFYIGTLNWSRFDRVLMSKDLAASATFVRHQGEMTSRSALYFRDEQVIRELEEKIAKDTPGFRFKYRDTFAKVATLPWTPNAALKKLIASSDVIEFQEKCAPKEWSNDANQQGEGLSDHWPVSTVIRW